MTTLLTVSPEVGPYKQADQSKAQPAIHPRRSPPHNSISMPPRKKQKLGPSPVEERSTNATSRAVPLKEQSSQESGSDQSASKWFNKVNEHVTRGTREETAYDNEPPFYMSHQNNYVPNTFHHSDSDRLFGGLSRMDSENEDLRGVIDDLTVENKKLKHILREHRGRRETPTSEAEDKLFEVRMHALPAEKRRELESLLKNFATSLHSVGAPQSNSTSNSAVSSSTLAGKHHKTDSGYASASNSGQVSLAHSRHPRPILGNSKISKDKHIKSYLHDIPDTLMPRQTPIVMSDRAKMALVVRRLEQLFTGKNATPGEHSQPLQQQELSQMAARADARESKLRRNEGSREAHILPPDSKVNFDTVDAILQKGVTRNTESDASASEDHQWPPSRSNSPDQRPTRPLDLDINRAQVAAENIQYIRHLGLSSPRVDTITDSKESSWIYLNLLISMAQLHTINVTPEFVRRAIKKLSTKFELAKDGHRVRWIGGSEGTTFSKEEERALEAVDSLEPNPQDFSEDAGVGADGQRSRTDSSSNAVMSNTASEDKTSGLQTSSGFPQQLSTAPTSHQVLSQANIQTRAGSSFDYKPVVYRDKVQDLELAYLQDEDSSPDTTSRDSSGLVHALSKSNLNQQRSSDAGLMTFYNNPYFCSDYSGDKMPSNLLADRPVNEHRTLGFPRTVEQGESTLRYSNACYFMPQFGPAGHSAHEDRPVQPFYLAPLQEAGESETQPMEFPVSGLGGVTPDDNFVLDVKIDMTRSDRGIAATKLRRTPFVGTKVVPRYTYKRAAVQKIDLLPSKLPPPSYVFFTSSSSSDNAGIDEESGLDDADDTSSSMDEDNPVPPTFLQHWSTEHSDENGEPDDDESESSVDMLALARATDPERIAEQERQYVITQPGAPAIEGSLAATVGASRSSSSAGDINSDVSAHGSGTDMDEN